MRYAYYSAKAAEYYGTQIWLTEDGQEVHATRTGSTKDPSASMYGWSDARTVGRVVRYVRAGLVANGGR